MDAARMQAGTILAWGSHQEAAAGAGEAAVSPELGPEGPMSGGSRACQGHQEAEQRPGKPQLRKLRAYRRKSTGSLSGAERKAAIGRQDVVQ